jgi:1-acyl-sn-glycerol-3-phosphate acyltransferase
VQRSAFVWNLSKYMVLALSKVWFRLRVEGRDNLPATGPVLVVSNHASYLDPPMIGITSNRWVGFLAQAGLARFGPLRWWLAQVGVTLIDRKAPSKEAMRIVTDCLVAGEAVGIFAEGTRSRDGAVGPFRTGVEFLVRRTGARVVPVGIDGAFRAFPPGALVPRPRRIVVRYGEVWPAERVLAPGGIEALRHRVASLANAPLRDGRDAARAPATTIDPSSSSSAGSGA